MRKKKKGGVEYYEGSDNVYKDLGYKNPEEWATKAALATKIYDIIEERKMTQKQAAEILGIDQPGVSDLRRGRFRRFSVARLLAFLRALDRDVDIVIRPKVQDVAQIMVEETTTPSRLKLWVEALRNIGIILGPIVVLDKIIPLQPCHKVVHPARRGGDGVWVKIR